VSQPLIKNLESFLLAAIIIVLFFGGLLVAYNLCAGLNAIFVGLKLKPLFYPTGEPQRAASGPGNDEFKNAERIGIVLAGGGAKGAFQAGAMKAIYRYLEEKGALNKVSVIAGTSIGSWNSLFWLADLIKSATGWDDEGVHEGWWNRISAKSLTAPSWYVPFLRNAFLSSAPWQQVFDRIFLTPQVADHIKRSGVHFYFTRSNVMTGELECATNNSAHPRIPGVTYEVLDPARNRFMQGLRAAVFASMDLPPLFPYIRRNGKLFEDGGVIDNVPIEFAAVEGCDLIFVLPLNSDFEETPNETSIFARLFRVMDVRQGVLERDGFKLVYLYNELAALREDDQDLRRKQGLDPTPGGGSPLAVALRRPHRHINVFAMCPLRSFVSNTIQTPEFWKRKAAGVVFRIMYEATWKQLQQFGFAEHKHKVRIGLVSEGGGVCWKEDIF